MTAQLSAQLAAQPAAQHTLGFGHALLGEVLHVPAFSAAGDPRLAGVTSRRVRTAVVGSNGMVDLTHSIAEASYALGFNQTVIRSQLVAVPWQRPRLLGQRGRAELCKPVGDWQRNVCQGGVAGCRG
jgi:hypothetical protein